MTRSSSGVGSVSVPSIFPEEREPWENNTWGGAYAEDGEQLGAGGWGIVRRVRHLASGDLLALKEPSRDDEEVRARFRREVEVGRKVRHRNVMPVLDHGRDYDWFTMPLAERRRRPGGASTR